MGERLRGFLRWVGPPLAWGLRIALAGALLWLAYLIVDDESKKEVALPVAALAIVALLIATVSASGWSRLFDRVGKLSLGPFAIEALADARSAATATDGRALVDDGGPDGDNPAVQSHSLLELRFKLERKLTYIAKHMLGASGRRATFLTIGSLEYDGYLTLSEARTATRILTLSELEFDSLSGSQQRTFLRYGNQLADDVRARVLTALVRREAGKEAGWKVEELPGGKRPDLLIEKAGRRYRVTTVFALDRKSKLLDKPVRRLGKADEPRVDEKLVVVPHGSKAMRAVEPNDVTVMTIDEYKDRLLKV